MVARLEQFDRATCSGKESNVQLENDYADTSEREELTTKTPNVLDPSRPRNDYYANHREVEPFPDSNALEVKTLEEKKANHAELVLNMILRAKDCGLPQQYWGRFEDIVHTSSDVFGASFCAETSRVDPLKIELRADA